MRVADLVTSAARLHDALQTLRVHWDETRDLWRDTVSAEFEKNYIEPLELDVLGALERMRALSGVMSSAEQECQ